MANRDLLIVVDMQNDFVTGALANKDAQAIIPDLVKFIEEWKGLIVFTQDTHSSDYLDTLEGRNLPVPHCIYNTKGWEIIPELRELADKRLCLMKHTFGDIDAVNAVPKAWDAPPTSVTFVGVCTDICVIANAVIAKTLFPETPIRVMANLCAGVTPESHRNALNAMRALQIEVIE